MISGPRAGTGTDEGNATSVDGSVVNGNTIFHRSPIIKSYILKVYRL